MACGVRVPPATLARSNSNISAYYMGQLPALQDGKSVGLVSVFSSELVSKIVI